MPVSFACPQCRAVIRSPKPLPAGQRVKCPKCARVFAVSGNGAASGITAQRPGAAPGLGFDAGQRPAARRPKPSGMAMMNLCMLFALFMIGGAAIAAATWWGIQKPAVAVKETKGDSPAATAPNGAAPEPTKPADKTPDAKQPDVDLPTNTGTGKEEALAYVPHDSSVIVGADIGAIGTLRPDLIDLLRDLAKKGPDEFLSDPKKDIGLEFADFYNQVIIAVKLDLTKGMSAPPTAGTFIITSKVEFDQRRVAMALPRVGMQKIKDKVVFDIKHKELHSAFMPSSRILVLTSLEGEKLEALVGSDGTQTTLPAQTAALVRRAQKGPAWVVVPFDETMKKGMEEGVKQKLKVPPEVQNAIINSGAAALLLNGDPEHIKVTFSLACAKGDDAQLLAGLLQAVWNGIKGQITQQVTAALKEAKLPPDVETIVKNIVDTMSFAPNDTLAEVSLQFDIKPIETLVKQAMDPMTGGSLLAGLQGAFQKAQQAPPEGPFQMTPAEKQLLDLVNKSRADEKLPALKPNPKLFAIAREHAKNMAKNNAADDEIDGKDNGKRLEAAGYKFQMATANLAVGPGWGPANAHQIWINNAAAKANILEKYTETGIGIAPGANGAVFFYQIFVTPAE